MKIGKFEMAWNEWEGWRKVLPYKRILLALFLVTMVIYVFPRTVFPNEVVDLLGARLVVWTFSGGLLSGIMLLIAFASDGLIWVKRIHLFKGKDARRRIDNLTPYSKAIVRSMYETDTRSRKFNILEITWTELNVAQILSPAKYRLLANNEIACYLKPWVCAYLDANPDFLNQLPVIKDDGLPF